MRLFIILPRVPYPTEKGDKLRAFYQIRQLAKTHDVILCALNDGDLHEDAIPVLKKFVSAIHIIPLSKASIAVNLIKSLFSKSRSRWVIFTIPRRWKKSINSSRSTNLTIFSAS